MKKLVFLSVLFLSMLDVFAADLPKVNVKQFCQKPGGTYAELTTALLPADKVNLKYEFAMTAKKNDSAVIDCMVEFPGAFNVMCTSSSNVLQLKGKNGAKAFVTATPSRYSLRNNDVNSVESLDRNYELLKGKVLDKVKTPEYKETATSSGTSFGILGYSMFKILQLLYEPSVVSSDGVQVEQEKSNNTSETAKTEETQLVYTEVGKALIALKGTSEKSETAKALTALQEALNKELNDESWNKKIAKTDSDSALEEVYWQCRGNGSILGSANLYNTRPVIPYTRCEFLLPHEKTEGSTYVEFQVDIPTSFAGKSIPVVFYFTCINAGLLDSPIGKLIKSGKEIDNIYGTPQEVLCQIRGKYKTTQMSNSVANFTLQVQN